MNTSLLPGMTAYRPPKVVRPKVMRSVTNQMVSRARPAMLDRHRAMQTAIPTASRMETTGKRPSSYSWPVNSQ